MKQIKLEVGKTYRSRKGEEVRIVEKKSWGAYPYNGDNGEWYAENGVFDYDAGESSFDLIEEVEEVPEYTRILEWVENYFNDNFYDQEDIAEIIDQYLKHREGKK